MELINRNDRVCLTLHCSEINKGGTFRKETNRPDFQTCYFNAANDEQVYNEFVGKWINESESSDRIQKIMLYILVII